MFCLQASRETGALKEAKDILEKKVEELTYRVQLEKRLRVNIFSRIDIKEDIMGIFQKLFLFYFADRPGRRKDSRDNETAEFDGGNEEESGGNKCVAC